MVDGWEEVGWVGRVCCDTSPQVSWGRVLWIPWSLLARRRPRLLGMSQLAWRSCEYEWADVEVVSSVARE